MPHLIVGLAELLIVLVTRPVGHADRRAASV